MDEGRTPAQDADLVAHERTYKAFNVLLRWCAVAIGSAILSLTLWFVTPAGWFGGLLAGAVVFALCYPILLRQEDNRPLDVWSPDR